MRATSAPNSKKAGTPIGHYDYLIAAQARRRGATLVTANVREFARVPGLLLADGRRERRGRAALALGRPYAVQEPPDFRPQPARLARKRLRRRKQLRRRTTRGAGIALHLGDVEETSWVPRAASSTLRAISWVAAPCCSTAAAMADDIFELFDRVADVARWR